MRGSKIDAATLRAALIGSIGEFTRLDAGDPGRRRIFVKQVDATIASLRRLLPLAIVMAVICPPLFWHDASRAMLTIGGTWLAITCAWALRFLPRAADPEAPRRAAAALLVTALLLGIGWAFLTYGIELQADEDAHLLGTAIQVALIAIGLILYVNLPGAFICFAVPIAVPLALTFSSYYDDTLIALPLLPIYLIILARNADAQCQLFVDAHLSADRLAETEAQQRAIEREAAEGRARRLERDADAARLAEDERRAGMLALAGRFESSVVSVVDQLADAVASLDRSARSLTEIAHYSVGAARDTADRATATARSVSALAVAAEQLTDAIADISAQVGAHAERSDRAQRSAETSGERMAAMADEAERVGGIVTMIAGVTRETKLLALNATIEAARAGDAGRGFAVVASEVKSLAHRAGDATRDVTAQVDSIASHIGLAVASLRDTSSEIVGVAAIAGAIAGSIDAQRAATAEIGRETRVVAGNVGDMRDRMSELADGAGRADRLVDTVGTSARSVAGQAAALREATARFLSELRAA